MRFYPKHYGLIAYPDIVLLKLLLLSLFGQEVVLPVEVNLDAYRLAKQNDLSAVDYHDLMMDNIDEVSDKRLQALKEIEKDKFRVARAYNKKVRAKSFQVGELVWKTILPLGTKSNKFGKWSPSWEGPYKIVKVIFWNSYMVETMQGERLPQALNRRYLKMKTAGIEYRP